MTFRDFIGSGSTGIIGIINTVIVPVIFAFAFLVFLWGILGMVVLLSVWGFVNIVLSTLGIMPSS